ncbi:65-kDa microtubule-associated protein 5 [Curcuma longa]|uniref:65-kDa microtubule-associated protein 5 n=1 Tax=Curcuma longa TaxID=136217 RepID=UPI003D9F2FB0
MPRLSSPSPSRTDATSCGSLLQELQDLWDEIGEKDIERDREILQLEQECLDLYRKKVDRTRKHKAELHQMLAEGEAEISSLISTLGERESFLRIEKATGSLKEQLARIKPLLEDLRHKKQERITEFQDVQSEIITICSEISGNIHHGSSLFAQVDERDLTIKRLGDLKSQLLELQKDKNVRLQKVNIYIKQIHDLSLVLSIDFNKMICEVHPSFGDSAVSQTKSISNDTLARLAGIVHSLNQEKKQRLQKLQDLGSTLVELWNLMDTPMNEREKFDHITCLISSSVDSVQAQGCLALDIIEKVELEVERLNVLKAGKMKEIVLKKQTELDEIYKSVHMDVDIEGARRMLVDHIDSGKVDLSELLSSMDNQIAKAKEQALSRKDILEKVDKWKYASDEEIWLDDYEKDENRYSAGRGVHKNLKRAEKARILVNKIPALVENLTTKIKAWERENGIPFMYDKTCLMDSLEEYTRLRQQREEEKRRSREQKKLQEQLATEQEALFGSKPSPMRQLSAKRPLGQSSITNMACGTPIPGSRRVSTPYGRHGISSSGKEKKSGKGNNTVAPVNYVSLQKDDSLARNKSVIVSP